MNTKLDVLLDDYWAAEGFTPKSAVKLFLTSGQTVDFQCSVSPKDFLLIWDKQKTIRVPAGEQNSFVNIKKSAVNCFIINKI